MDVYFKKDHIFKVFDDVSEKINTVHIRYDSTVYL